MTSFFRTETITLAEILHKTSPSPISPGFLSKVSSGKIEKPLFHEFQQDQYTIFGLHLQIPYRDQYLMSQNYWKLEFCASHQHPSEWT